MASAARRARGAGRRPFTVLASSSPARRNGGAITWAENVAPHEAVPLSQPQVRRVGKKCAGGRAGKKHVVTAAGSSPVSVSRKPAAATASRRRMSSLSKMCSTPRKPTAKARRLPLRDLSEDRARGKVRAHLSSPFDEVDREGEERRSARKRMARSAATEEATASLPEPGEGRVKYLVGTFERLLSLAGGGPESRSGGATKVSSKRRKSEATPAAMTSLEPSLTPPQAVAEEIDASHPSSEVSFPAITGVACILDASDRTSMIRAAREHRRQRRRNVSATSHRPFNLRTEQRGKAKEENFARRMRKMQLEEAMMRNTLAQGLPFTTDEPECPVKPPTKEPTEPIDLVLHSAARAVGRAKFDHQVSCTLRCSLAVDEFLRALHRLSSILQVAERASFMEEGRLAKQRQQKMDEEVEIKQVRKERVPRAHPMPDFTKPFVPKRSVKPNTIPREPRFHPRLRRNRVKV